MESFLKENKAVLIFSCIAFYLSLVRYLRFKNIRTIREKYPDPEVVLRDPKIAEEIFSIMTKKEFPCKYTCLIVFHHILNSIKLYRYIS